MPETKIKKTSKRLIRIYPGVRQDQYDYIKKEAERLSDINDNNIGDGETLRHMIDFYITNNPHT